VFVTRLLYRFLKGEKRFVCFKTFLAKIKVMRKKVIYLLGEQSHKNSNSCTQGRNDVVARGAQFPGRRIAMGAPKSPNNVTSTLFSTVDLLPNDLTFEHGGAKLASCPGRHLTSLRRWVYSFAI